MREENSLSYLAAEAKSFDAGTAKLAYRSFGEGPPIVFIHGWPLSGFTWRKIVPELAKRHRCITVDLPGAGSTEWRDDNDFSFTGHARNLARWTAALGLDDYSIVAHDTGATVARELALIDAERVRRLVLIDTEIPHHRPMGVPLFQKIAGLRVTSASMRLLLGSARFRRSLLGFGTCFHDRTLIDGDFTEGFVEPLRTSDRSMEGQMRYAQGIDWAQLDALAEGHGRIHARVQLIWGRDDPFFPIARAREMIPQFRDCRGLIEIPNAKLLPHEERPDLVARHVQEFIDAD